MNGDEVRKSKNDLPAYQEVNLHSEPLETLADGAAIATEVVTFPGSKLRIHL